MLDRYKKNEVYFESAEKVAEKCVLEGVLELKNPKKTESQSVSVVFRFVSWNQNINFLVCLGV